LVSRGETRRRAVLASAIVLLIIVASVGGFYLYKQLNPAPSTPPTCAAPLGGAKILRTQLAPATTLGGVTEYALPTPLREPNAPTVAPDGSVWFTEQSVVALAHFYPGNRTLVEYAWPYNYTTPSNTDGVCGDKTSTWGVVLWDGKVWATDTSGNQLVALNPATSPRRTPSRTT
jgi:streptogramin lyase